MNFSYRLQLALNIMFRSYGDYWDKPNGCCSQCGAPLNEYMIGGYKLHDGTFAVAAEVKK